MPPFVPVIEESSPLQLKNKRLICRLISINLNFFLSKESEQE